MRHVLTLTGLFFASAAFAEETDAGTPPWTLSGYAEAYYQWNLNDPSNGITNFRGFDNRHNSVTLSNAALDAEWDASDVVGRLAAQVGATPSTYYQAEPALPGTAAANGSSSELWKFLQQAYVGYRFHLPQPLLLTAGLCLSPMGPEAIAVKDNWNYSRSNLFFGLPFYHSGIRAEYALTDRFTAMLALFNGWNNVLDNNPEKSVAAQLRYSRSDGLAGSLLLFSGVERPPGAPEGRAWRHSLDANVTIPATERLSFTLHGNVGIEPNAFGLSHWQAGAAYLRFKLLAKLFLAARGDVFFEHAASNASGEASRIFWPGDWVSSGTGTIDFRPAEKVSFRLEYRHDEAATELFFEHRVHGNGLDAPFVPNARRQDTVTLGATAWF